MRATVLCLFVVALGACSARELGALEPDAPDVVAPVDFGGACTYTTATGTCTLVETGEPMKVLFEADDPQILQQTFLKTFGDAPRGADPACAAASFDEIGDTVRCEVKLITSGTCTPWHFTYPEVCP